MKDIKLYIDKLHADAEDCLTISRTATTDAKRNVFAAMAGTYRKLAGELERIAAANAILDHQRNGHLFGILSDEGSDGLDIAGLRSTSRQNGETTK